MLHAYVNWNKRSLRLDAAAISGVIAWADVVITSEPLGDLDLAALRSDAVHLSITAHGLEGALAGARGNNLTASARSAWAHVNAYAEEPPLQLPSRQAGYVGGLAGFVAASAALWRRADGPEPERVDVSELEALAVTCQPWGLAAIYEARPYSQGPAGGKRRSEPGPLYQARDGKINFGFGDWHNWPQAMELLNLPDQGAREELIPHGGRYVHDMSAVQAGTARELVEIDRWPLFHSLARLRCIAGCLQSVDQLVENEQLNDRRLFVETQVGGRTLRAPGAPGQIEPPIWSQRTPAPRTGEQTDSIVAELAAPPVAAATPRGTGPAGPLDGVRVLAFTQAWSGTLATQLLGLLGLRWCRSRRCSGPASGGRCGRPCPARSPARSARSTR